MNIVISNLKKNYNSVQALNIPSLTIGNGDLVGLVGNNGAGKTTMMRLILDLIQASEGKVEIEGENVAENPVWKTFTGSYLDSSFLIEFYTPEEFFGFIAEIVVAKLIRKMNEDCGTTVLVSSHNLNSISDICNRIILLDKGDIIMDKPHTSGSKDQELESYFLAAVK